jgi:hypothetical protein
MDGQDKSPGKAEQQKTQPRPIHNPQRELNSRSSITEPADGRSWEDAYADNPYLNDEYMTILNSRHKSALRYRPKRLSKGEGMGSSHSLGGLALSESSERVMTPPPALRAGRKKEVILATNGPAPQSSDELSSSSYYDPSKDFKDVTWHGEDSRIDRKDVVKQKGCIRLTKSTSDIVFVKDADLAPPLAVHELSDIADTHSLSNKGKQNRRKKSTNDSSFGSISQHNDEGKFRFARSSSSFLDRANNSPIQRPRTHHKATELKPSARRRAQKGKCVQMKQYRDMKRLSQDGLAEGQSKTISKEKDEESFLSSLAAFGKASQRADTRKVVGRNDADCISVENSGPSSLENSMFSEDGLMPSWQVLQALEKARSGSLRSATSDTSSSSNAKEAERSSLASVLEEDSAKGDAFLSNVHDYGSPEVSKSRLWLHEFSSTVSRTISGAEKKKLILENMTLTSKDLPLNAICSKPLGAELHKLSLAGNRLQEVPVRLVQELHGLHTLDLQQCDLFDLPTQWNLKSLRRLILSHNKLECFDEVSLRDRYMNDRCSVPRSNQYFISVICSK